MALFNDGRIVVRDTSKDGLLTKEDRTRKPMIAEERIVVDGRQLYAKGQVIDPRDARRLGIIDGKLPPDIDQRPRRRRRNQKEAGDAVALELLEQDAGDDEVEAEEQVRPARPSNRKRRGARRAS